MKFFEAKDIVREHFSRLKFTTSMLIQSLTQGRRRVERHANFWWMTGIKSFNLVVDQATYSITTSGSGGLNLPNFKDHRSLLLSEDSGVTFTPVPVGEIDRTELDSYYMTTQPGVPEQGAIEDTTLVIFPPKPQLTYPMKLYYYQWTDNPTDNNTDDDLLKFFPMALVYSSIEWAYTMVLKDLVGAQYWKGMLGGEPFGSGGELAELKIESLKRDKYMAWHIGDPTTIKKVD